MTPIGYVIQPGQPIPDDVTGLRSRKGAEFVLNELGHWHMPEWADPRSCARDEFCGYAAADFARYAPLTVTAVREQPAEPEPDEDLRAVADQHCGAEDTHAGHRWRNNDRPVPHWRWCDGYVGRAGVPAEPEPDVLDLVRQYGTESYQLADPLVLSLPQVPEGARLVGRLPASGDEIRLTRRTAEGEWYDDDGDFVPRKLGAVLDALGTVTVVMREPRTWEALEPAPKDLKLFQGASGEVYMPWTTFGGELSGEYLPKSKYDAGETMLSFHTHRLSHWREVDGPLVEVFDDEDGTR